MASGTLKRDEKTGMLEGRYDDLHNHLSIALEPRFADVSEMRQLVGKNQPAYTVYAAGSGGRLTEVGAGWIKETREGESFITITIDDPSFSAGLNLTAFQAKNTAGEIVAGQYDVVWRRPRQAAA